MRGKHRAALLLIAGCALLGLAADLREPREATPTDGDASGVRTTAPSLPTPADVTPAAVPAPASPRPVSTPAATPIDPVVALADALFALRDGTADPAEVLARLRAQLRAAEPTAAAAAVADFLAAGSDAPTGLPFRVGEEGVLASAPSLRVAVMDVLPALDPEVALQMARLTMDARTSSDEYAISLRNLAWNDFEGDLRAEMGARFATMLAEPSWRAAPGPAFLEAFDVAVAVGDAGVIDALLGAVTPGAKDAAGRALNRAAFIALDRIVLTAPERLVALTESPPAALAANPDLRASLLSRLDITDAAQRAAFSAYLTDPQVSAAERGYFAELFPNGNYTQGARLVTADEATPSITERARLDARIDAELANLAATTPPGPAAETIARIRARLAEYLAAPR